jgi:hypothetical protein
MINFSNYTALINSYTKFLAQSNVAKTSEPFYLKWLRYYLDFCQKYSENSEDPSSLPTFIEKLKSKNQSDDHCTQAQHAITLYYNLINAQAASPVKNQQNVKFLLTRGAF